MTDIVRSKGGTKERRVPIEEIAVPDLWFIALEVRKKISEAASEEILDCWCLAHDLKRHIEGA